MNNPSKSVKQNLSFLRSRGGSLRFASKLKGHRLTCTRFNGKKYKSSLDRIAEYILTKLGVTYIA